MGSTNLALIKRRMKSIKNTLKITKAMGVISNSKLQKCRVKLYSHNEFYNEYKYMMSGIIHNLDKNSIYLKGNESKKTMYILITSDLGLCGGFNTNTLSAFEKDISNLKEDNYIIVCGQKGRDYVRRKGFSTIAEYVDLPQISTVGESKVILSKALSYFENNDIGEVKIVYYEYVSQLKKNIKIDTLLPLELEEKADFDKFDIAEELDSKILIETFLNQKVLNCLINAKMSEHSFRIEATNNANKNGSDLLDKLKQKYNRARQSSITNEICEIIGGAEALK